MATRRARLRTRRVRGVVYFGSSAEAHRAAAKLRKKGYPEARVVHYEKGWAVQLRKSGSYV